MNIIPDEILITIPIEDNREELVDIKLHCPEVVVGIPDYLKEDSDEAVQNASFVRISVANMLNEAQKKLPSGLKLFIECAYRSPKLQQRRYNVRYKIIQEANPTWDEHEVKKETDKWVAPLEIVPPHCTGGALDISIVHTDGTLLDMGTPLNTYNKKTLSDCPDLTPKQKENRLLLFNTLNTAGFVNYPLEWWHWTYGDRYWAAVLNRISIYDIKNI